MFSKYTYNDPVRRHHLGICHYSLANVDLSDAFLWEIFHQRAIQRRRYHNILGRIFGFNVVYCKNGTVPLVRAFRSSVSIPNRAHFPIPPQLPFYRNFRAHSARSVCTPRFSLIRDRLINRDVTTISFSSFSIPLPKPCFNRVINR